MSEAHSQLAQQLPVFPEGRELENGIGTRNTTPGGTDDWVQTLRWKLGESRLLLILIFTFTRRLKQKTQQLILGIQFQNVKDYMLSFYIPEVTCVGNQYCSTFIS